MSAIFRYAAYFNAANGLPAHSCLYIFTAAYGLSFGPIAWILPNEVLPLAIRSKGAAAATASNWINNCEMTAPSLSLSQEYLTVFIGLITPTLITKSPSYVLQTSQYHII